MGGNIPNIGERVAYYTSDTAFTIATVVDVTYWDLVDLELSDGVRLSNVRRVVMYIDEGRTIRESIPGRFERIYEDEEDELDFDWEVFDRLRSR